MRPFVLAAALSLLSPSALRPQEPISIVPRSGLCARVDNSERCAQIVEPRQLRRSRGQVRRVRRALTLQLRSGRRMTVSADTAGDEYASPYYIGTLSTLGYYVLFVQHYEGSAVQLINVRTGWSTYLRDMPVVSPDRRRFVVAEQNTERYDPQRLQIWHVDRDTLRLEWGLTPEGDTWMPDSVRWLSSSSFRFVRAVPPEGPEQWTPDTAKLNTRKKWTTARP